MRTISAKISDDEFLLVNQIATEKEITISNLIKQSIFTANICNTKKQDELKREKLKELNRIGNNLNQIARNCNTKKIIDQLILEEIIKIRESLKKC